jgi:urea transport system permease protein
MLKSSCKKPAPWPMFSIVLLLCVATTTICLADQQQSKLIAGLGLLGEASFRQKTKAIETIAQSGDERARPILKTLLAGDLYLLKADKSVVRVKHRGDSLVASRVLNGSRVAISDSYQLKKIIVNNAMRSMLKDVIARLNLHSHDPSVRWQAVREMLPDLTPSSTELLQTLLQTEKNKKVINALHTALALINLQSPEANQRLAAVKALKGNLEPVAHNRLDDLMQTEKNPQVREAAKQVLKDIDSSLSFYNELQTIFFGLSLGSVLVLASIGLAITFGVIGVINMAHGELIMIGAYTTYVIQQLLPGSIGWALGLSVPAAFCVAGLVGVVIEKTVIRFLYGRPLETLLATFGISLILQQAVRTIFSPLNRSVATPAWMSGSIVINPVLSLTTNRLCVFVFALLVFAGLFVLLKKSSLGLHVRAVSQNRAMARAMGVRAARVDALTFGLGSGIAGIAGVALSQLTNVGPNLGQSYIIDSFMVVVFGGVGNLWGTLLGGLSLGIANKFLEPWSGAVLAKILILVCIILFIQKRPQGMFPQKGRAAEL